MPLSDKDFKIRLCNITDPVLLCDILDISTEELIEAFEDKIEERLESLRDIYDIDIDDFILYDE
tara:strand:- start:906 stop:1097 length:192 start_codon:yes stop_codon:yes gene_type:complete